MLNRPLESQKTTLTDGYAMESFDIPLDLERRWEWIKFQLRVRGTNLAELARDQGLSDSAVRNAKKRPYPSVEREIAKALGLQPAQLWPERWNSNGSPIRQRPNRAESNTVSPKHTEKGPDGHSKTQRKETDA
ncbi:Ner family transcriptional regulator [Pseudomonas costantinii]|uniref:Ner family transcriptional regulator n=2 Tax=Pseudomonas costantinii TaxID=168469 RepID=A0A1H5IBD1_9PSED|nr:Ner family transcriptional regulator [Pseudomonas costantinii]